MLARGLKLLVAGYWTEQLRWHGILERTPAAAEKRPKGCIISKIWHEVALETASARCPRVTLAPKKFASPTGTTSPSESLHIPSAVLGQRAFTTSFRDGCLQCGDMFLD